MKTAQLPSPCCTSKLMPSCTVVLQVELEVGDSHRLGFGHGAPRLLRHTERERAPDLRGSRRRLLSARQ